MPFARPTLTQIAARVKTDIQGALEGTAAFFRRSFERAAQGALTGVSHQLHGHIEWIARQLDPRTADDDVVEKVHGEPFGVFKKAPGAAQLSISVTGTDGQIVPAATVYIRADGARYTVDAAGTIDTGSVILTVTAELAGQSGNTDDATSLDIESPIPGVAGEATVIATTTVGGDVETPEDYLERVIQRRQSPPRGGAKGDYAAWVLEVPGVTRVWVYPRQEGVGTVTIYAANDAGDPITLTPSKITEIEEYLAEPGRVPVTATAIVRTPILSVLPLAINIRPDTLAVRQAIDAELRAYLLRVGDPGGVTLLISQINEAISIAAGEEDHVLVSPVADVVVPFGELPTLGVITWGSL